MKNKFLSHIKKDKDGNIYFEKELIKHITGIKKIVEKSISSHWIEYKELIVQIVKLHDLGKYTDFFQEYLVSGKPCKNNLQFHSFIGAVTILNMLKEEDEKLALIAYFIIFHHHTNLNDLGECYPQGKKNISINNVRLKSQYSNLLSKLKQINEELEIEINVNTLGKEVIELLDLTDDLKDEENIHNYFIINYLFSLLIEGDKLDASDTPYYRKKYIASNLVDSFILSLNADPQNKQNIRRNKARRTVLANLEREDITQRKLFTLTAPTGIGKTLAALDFALKLRAKIREEEGIESQIIYALPFINIIEQSLEVYKNVLPGYVKLQAHYQFADVFDQTKNYSEYKNYNQKTMQLDTWQSDIVITSFVQFLQTLIGYRNKILKKFHHLADSIIILDEVQTLKLGHLPLIGAALYYASKFLNARIILMTATKPLTYQLAMSKLYLKEKIESLELLTNYQEVFEKWFNRTKLIPLLGITLENEADFITKVFEPKWKENKKKSCLIVCNTVNRSIAVFKEIEKFLSQNKFKNPIYYLSTNIIPAHRLDIIHKIKEDLKREKYPILISTQVVEAGVDLDFDMGFRDLAPLDSIIQVAGRINRSDKKGEELPLYIMDFGDCSKIYDQITEKHSRDAFAGKFSEGVAEKNYLELIQAYFENVSNESGYSQSRTIFQAMKELKYDGTQSEIEEYKTVSSFQVIEEKGGVSSIFIEIDNKAKEVKEKFELLQEKKIKKESFEPFKKDFHQRIVNVPTWILDGNLDNISDNILIVKKKELNDYYDSKTGFIRKKVVLKTTLIL